MIILPRQAQDKHRKSAQKRRRFVQVGSAAKTMRCSRRRAPTTHRLPSAGLPLESAAFATTTSVARAQKEEKEVEEVEEEQARCCA
jgi:hypothetical protein